MKQAEYNSTISNLLLRRGATTPETSTAADELLSTLFKAEVLLFEGKEDIQPIKWHQLTRIYKLAVTCIEIVRILWPYIKLIISIIKK